LEKKRAQTFNHGVIHWLVSALRLQVLDLPDDTLAVDYSTKDDVLLV
jgi:hypothetical protein